MEITWLGHSCLRLRGRDATVVTDPFDRTLGYPPIRTSADVVTISHHEPHHDYVQAVGGNPTVVDGPGEYEIAGVLIHGVATRRDRGRETPKPRNTAYVIRIDDLVVCHLGDLDQPLNADQIAAMKEADVLLIPVGGNCTISAAEASEVVAQLEPRLVIPMHYRTEATRGLNLDPVDRFCREMGVTPEAPQARLSVTKSTLPESATVVLLDYRR